MIEDVSESPILIPLRFLCFLLFKFSSILLLWFICFFGFAGLAR